LFKRTSKMKKRTYIFSSIILACALLATIDRTQSAHALVEATFEIDNPGVQYNQFGQNSDGNGSITVYNQTFNSTSGSTVSGNQHFDSSGTTTPKLYTNYQWTDNGTLIGTYNQVYVEAANQYGGAVDPTSSGSTSNFTTVNPNGSDGGLKTSTLTLASGEAYFGLWWSAGDTNNVLTFYDTSGHGLGTFDSSSITAAIQQLSSSQQALYKGNPNNRTQDSNEYFAYINFFDTSGATIGKVVFSNAVSTGFESDDHAVAASYNNIRGQVIGTLVPFKFSPAQGFILGIPLFLGLRQLKKRMAKNNVYNCDLQNLKQSQN
jgi:hypothetical protein